MRGSLALVDGYPPPPGANTGLLEKQAVFSYLALIHSMKPFGPPAT